MSERGDSLDPVRMLNVASRRKLRAARGRVQRGPESQNLRPPHMRVQRTRSSASPPRSPLTRQNGASEADMTLRPIGLLSFHDGGRQLVLDPRLSCLRSTAAYQARAGDSRSSLRSQMTRGPLAVSLNRGERCV